MAFCPFLFSKEQVNDEVHFISYLVHLQPLLCGLFLYSGGAILLFIQAHSFIHGRPEAVRGLHVAAERLLQSTPVNWAAKNGFSHSEILD